MQVFIESYSKHAKGWNWRLWANYAVGTHRRMWSIFYLILCEKNFLGLGAPACLLDLGVCHFNALAVDVCVGGGGLLWIWRCSPSDLPLGFRGELNVNYQGNSI